MERYKYAAYFITVLVISISCKKEEINWSSVIPGIYRGEYRYQAQFDSGIFKPASFDTTIMLEAEVLVYSEGNIAVTFPNNAIIRHTPIRLIFDMMIYGEDYCCNIVEPKYVNDEALFGCGTSFQVDDNGQVSFNLNYSEGSTPAWSDIIYSVHFYGIKE